MDNLADELRACPFCGRNDDASNMTMQSGVNLVQSQSPMNTRRYRVECNCGGCGAWKAEPAEAITAWNTRTPAPPTQDMVDRVAMRVYNLRPDIVLDYPQCEAVATAAIEAMRAGRE